MKRPSTKSLLYRLIVLPTISFFFSCGDSSDVNVYSIPKEKPRDLGPTWDVPDGWLPGKESTMRLGSYAVKDDNGSSLDISVTAFPGETGGILPNVNRWLGQIGLEAIEEADLEEYVTETKVDHSPAHLVQASNEGQSIRVFALTVHGKTWFFKLMGDADLAERERAKFDNFVKSIDFHAGHDHHDEEK